MSSVIKVQFFLLNVRKGVVLAGLLAAREVDFDSSFFTGFFFF